MPAKMKIRSAYSSLPTAERKVADFILANPEQASHMVINEIAAAAEVSVPSVTRLAKRMGYSGFMDFRVALASGTSSINSIKSDPVKPEDSDEVVVKKMTLSTMRALEDTLKALDCEKLSELAKKCIAAKQIYVFGTATGIFLANDLVQQLTYMGYNARAVSDAGTMEVLASRFTSEDVFIGISRSGRTKLLLDSVKAAKNGGCYTGFITNYINSPAAAYSDCFVCTSGVEDMKSLTGRESCFTMLTISSILTVLMARHDPNAIRK